MDNRINNSYRYYIIAQNRGNLLEIGITGQHLRIRRTAREVLANQAFLNGFSATEIALIRKLVADDEHQHTTLINHSHNH